MPITSIVSGGQGFPVACPDSGWLKGVTRAILERFDAATAVTQIVDYHRLIPALRALHSDTIRKVEEG